MTTPLHISCYNDFIAWAKKRKRALLVGAGIAAAGVGVYYYLQVQAAGKQEERKSAAEALEKRRREAEEKAEAQLQSHFESIQKISDATTLPSVLPHLKERLFELVDLSSLTEKLMAAKAGDTSKGLTSREKVQIWNDLKILSFSRTMCAMWAVSLLDLFVRTQLNILGRHVYIDTARESTPSSAGTSQEPSSALTMSCQHKFIAFADYLPHQGLDALIADAREAVQSVMQGKALRDPYSLEEVRTLFVNIRQALEVRQVHWINYVLPPDNVLPPDLAAASTAADVARGQEGDSAERDAAMLEQLMSETRSVLSSKEFEDVLAAALDSVTAGMVEELQDVYGKDPSVGIPLAKLLPPVATVGASLLEQPINNKYIEALAALSKVEAFCALVYTSMTPPQ